MPDPIQYARRAGPLSRGERVLRIEADGLFSRSSSGSERLLPWREIVSIRLFHDPARKRPWRYVCELQPKHNRKIIIDNAHYAGEGERSAGRSIGASLGELRRRNSALSPGSAEDFAQWVRTHLPSPPEAYRVIKGVNVGLIAASPEEIDVLEAGRNECAVR